MKAICHSRSEEETRAIGEALAESLIPDGVLLISGDLGSGKTVLTQGLATGLDIGFHQIKSPTFTLIREHRGNKGDLVHVDLYRLEGAQLDGLGLWEILAGPGVKAVEWSERLTFEFPEAIRVTLRVTVPPTEREVEIECNGVNRTLQRSLKSLSAVLV